MLEINLKQEEKSYPIYTENIDIDKFSDIIIPKSNNYLAVISERVEKLYGKTLNIPNSNKFILKDGEKEKNFKNYKKILDRAFELKLTRQDYIISVGGGVAGDIAGFAASTYMRGINLIQVPTTLLACVDSSVGGKTAINTKFGKNLIGAFYQPKAVFINPKFLKTLDDKQYKSGLGEVLKYAFIEKSCQADSNSNLVNFLSEKYSEIINRDEKTLSNLIEMCLILKKSVVEKDEKENNLRRILNFGHTYGHAVEQITGYKKYTHGEAVVEGIRFAFDLALQKGLVDENYKFIAADLIDKYGFKPLSKFNIKKIREIMMLDKKANTNSIIFILPTDYSTVEPFEVNIND